MVWSGDWGRVGSAVEWTPGIHSRKGLPVTSRKEERPCLPDVEEKTIPENILTSLFGRDSECSHMLVACEHLLCLFV